MTHSHFSRVLKYVNIAIALLLIAAAGVAYWYVWRPLPGDSGTIGAPTGAPVSVAYDSLGEPHIRAANLEDALFAQGYVTAQDRLFQMDGLRRLAAGDLAEIVGPGALESDREARGMRIRRVAEEAYGAIPAADRAALAAYARGVNQFIRTHTDSLPLEFTLLGYKPRPWSVVDSIIVTLHMYRDLTTTWRDEIAKRDMLAGGDRAKVDFLFPAGTGRGPQPGSNAWALAGSRTASGKPLLSNDMHLEYSMPGIWYMTALQAPGLDVAGVALPGTPGIIVGHNQRIAWGITNLHFDVQDLYIEKFDDRTGRYLYKGQVEQARAEREIIRVKGQAPTEMLVWVTRHGPLLLSEGTNRLTLRWAAAEPGVLQYPFLDINRAGNWQEFTAALSRFPGPGSNFVYADRDGHIGYHAAGKLPKRSGYRGDAPVDGSSGQFEWDGFIPFEQLPSVYDPPSGAIVSANQDVFPAGYPYPVNGNFAAPQRALRIGQLLDARGKWRPDDMLPVQTDIYSGFDQFLAKQIAAAYDRRHVANPGLDPAVAMLRNWNGQMDKDIAAPFLITLAFQYVRTAAAESASPNNGAKYEFTMSPVAIERLLREHPEGWFRDYDEMLLRALADAVDEGKRILGPDLADWKYGNSMNIVVPNPVVSHVPLVGKYFNLGPTQMSGSGRTVKQTTRTLAPSMRMNADLGDWERSLLNIQTGQSGQILSGHYKDQWKPWYEGKSFPMQFQKVDAKSELRFVPQ